MFGFGSRAPCVALALSAAGLVFGAYACSSEDGRKDQSYNTDAEANYGGPEAGIVTDSSTQSDKDADAGDIDGVGNSKAVTQDTARSADATVDPGAANVAQPL